MDKKRKYNGHNVREGHTIFPMPWKKWSATFMYVVCPEEAIVIGWYEAPSNPETGENNGLLGRLTEWRLGICAPLLGKPGYLQAELRALQKKCRERLNFQLCYPKVDNLKLFNVNKEEKKMTEYYVIDVELTDGDFETKRTTCLQIRQSGNYFEIPFDGPDISEYRLDRLYECLLDYINVTKKMFNISLEKSEICSNSVLKITTPYGDISDDGNRLELCKMLAYAAEHNKYPGPASKVGLSKICFYLRECKNREIYKKIYSKGIDCTITIEGKVFRDGLYFDYIPEPKDIIKLRFMDGELTHYTLADDPNRELIAAPGNTPGALYHIYKRDKPYRYVKELRAGLHEIYSKRIMWENASYVTFTPHGLTD